MTPDASKEVAAVDSYKASAPAEKPGAAAGSFFVVDGIVPDRSGKFKAGPNAVILPPPDSAKDSVTKPRQ